MYMHDGQNLFDPETSFVQGRTWQFGEHADQLILAGEIEPLIVVGVYNTPRRLEEYTHARDKRMGGGEAKNTDSCSSRSSSRGSTMHTAPSPMRRTPRWAGPRLAAW